MHKGINSTLDEGQTLIPSRGGEFDDVAHSLRPEGFDASEDGTGRGTPIVPIAIQERAVSENSDAGPDGKGFRDDGAAYTLEVRGTAQAIAFQERGRADGRSLEHQNEVAYALTAPNGGGRAQERNIVHEWAVRRLTPRECERLQGFPDDWTKIEWRNKPADQCPDGPRYKAVGNSFAVNVVRWIGERIDLIDNLKTGEAA